MEMGREFYEPAVLYGLPTKVLVVGGPIGELFQHRCSITWRTLQGIETMHMINKGRVRWLPKGDAVGQAYFVASLFGIAA